MSRISLNPSLNIMLQFVMLYKYPKKCNFEVLKISIKYINRRKDTANFKLAKDIRNMKLTFKCMYKPCNCFVFGIISHKVSNSIS